MQGPVLRPLGRLLPLMPETPKKDEWGEKHCHGWSGDASQSPLYVTDCHILLLRDAIAPAVVIEPTDEPWRGKYATEANIEEIWKRAETRNDGAADFIGVAEFRQLGDQVAFLRDPQRRVMAVGAYLLAFGLYAVGPDALTIDAAPIEATCLPRGQSPWFDTPLALRRERKLVGLLMPMRLSPDDYPHCDLAGEPIPLSEAFG